MEVISSHQNPRIKKLIKLHSSRGRQKQNRIAVFGSREILRALRSGVAPDEIFVCEPLADAKILTEIRELVAGFESLTRLVPTELFEKICFGDRTDGIVMTADRPELSMDRVFDQSPAPIIAVVESIEKPGNLGAILRSADGAGLDGLIVADPLTDWFHPNTIRSSLGTCFSVPGSVIDTETLRQRLIDDEFQVIVASLQGATDFYEADLTKKTAIVLGNEAKGVSDAWVRGEFQMAKLPMLGIADSLNVSATAAAMFYEARRQRR
ncbi:TrmH family RNA methyltransferase [Mariniblastus fucicola]|uniref:23S rRNA (Uridine(2479)-2'-O)-methyltransferase n=1 Tax=Mariniblastus fucicola TaxID=980251 RepID=A0A5B9P8H5_9BACT|nr:TrmH family RNA methyltransferase [Mariniblastus fucicola]QEG21819.1 23S rRNA (uridine(2479)-2'-O)-methyltransferase [Mariniblastus fucicola]